MPLMFLALLSNWSSMQQAFSFYYLCLVKCNNRQSIADLLLIVINCYALRHGSCKLDAPSHSQMLFGLLSIQICTSQHLWRGTIQEIVLKCVNGIVRGFNGLNFHNLSISRFASRRTVCMLISDLYIVLCCTGQETPQCAFCSVGMHCQWVHSIYKLSRRWCGTITNQSDVAALG